MNFSEAFGITVEVNAKTFDGFEVNNSNTINQSVDGGRNGPDKIVLRRVELKTMVRGPTRGMIDSVSEKGFIRGVIIRVANNKIISILKKDMYVI